MSRLALVAAAAFCLTPYASPGLALAIGLAIALAFGNPYPALTRKTTRPLLQLSVVLLGFGISVMVVFSAARRGFVLAAITIVFTFALGAVLRHILRLHRSTAVLLSAGTAICGGSAIAAVGLAITADEAQMSVALGTVFMLNAVALYLFPAMGHAIGLSQVQFGTWAGIAIHDVSSVVGAASSYGQVALQTATVVKLSRTLWIAPVALVARALLKKDEASGENGSEKRKAKITIPWFIALFLLASVASTFIGAIHEVAPALQQAGRVGMTLTLLLIGIGLSPRSLRAVGIRPVLHGLALWFAIGGLSLAAIMWFGQ